MKMSISKEQEELYKKTLEDVRAQLAAIDGEVEKELQRVRQTLAQLQEQKKSLKMVYEGIAKLLGIESDLEEDTTDTSIPKM
jgi:predicted  nucleic acid-binding Zn-ribbon protein